MKSSLILTKLGPSGQHNHIRTQIGKQQAQSGKNETPQRSNQTTHFTRGSEKG